MYTFLVTCPQCSNLFEAEPDDTRFQCFRCGRKFRDTDPLDDEDTEPVHDDFSDADPGL